MSFPGSAEGQLKNGVKSGAPARRRSSPARLTDLVGTQTLQGVVSKLIPHVHQAVAGVDVVQAVGLGLARGLADVLAVPEETVEVELAGIFAVRRQAWIATRKPQPRRSLASQALPLMSSLGLLGFPPQSPGV